MNSTIWKDNLREIKQSFPRFLSIFAIISLGVAFFIGIKATGPAMTQTAIQYFDNYQLPDGTILSTSGINSSDLDILAKQHGITWLPMKSFDSTLKPGTETAKIYTHKPQEPKHFFNIVQGHLPEASKEIALDTLLMKQMNEDGDSIQLGDVVTLEQPSNYNETSFEEETLASSGSHQAESNSLTVEAPHLLETEYTVVGFVETPLYFERISRGPGTVSTFAVVPEENVAGDIYSEVYYWVDEASAYDAYSDEYDAIALESKQSIEESLNGQPLARLNEMRRDLNQLLRDGRKEISDGYLEISNGHRLLSEGRKELDGGWFEYREGQEELIEGQLQLFEGRQELEDSQAALQAGWLELNANQKRLLENEGVYQAGLAEYYAGLSAFEDGIALAEAELKAGEVELTSAYAALEVGCLELIDGQRQIDEGRAELTAARQQLIDELTQQIPEGFEDPEAILAYLEEIGLSVESLVSQLEDDLSELPQQLETLGQELAAIQAEISELETSQETLLARQTELETSIETQEVTLVALHDNLVTKENTLSPLLEEVARIQALLEATPPTIPGELDPDTGEEGESIANPDYQSLQAQLMEVQSQAQQQSQLVSQAQTEVTAAQSQLTANQTELAEVNAQIETTQGQIERLRQSQIEKVSEVELLQELWADIDQEAIQQQIDELLASQTDIEAQIRQLIEAIEQMQAAEAQLNAAQTQLDAGWAEYASGLSQYEAGLSQLTAGRIQLDNERINGQSQLALAKAELDEGRIALDEGYTQLEEGRNALFDGQAQLSQGRLDLQDAWHELQHGKRLAYEGYRELRDGEEDYASNELTLLDEATAGLIELAEAEEELATAEEELATLEGPIYYVNGRDTLQPYESVYENAEKLNIISHIFPVFFFAIAVLVTFTTVKRMGSEQRNYMGTMKQMGYPTYVILSKFVTYAGLASVVGVIFGIIVGYRVFPPVIMNAYNMMYYLEDQVVVTSYSVNVLVAIIALSCALVPAIVTPINILKTQPAMLLQPEPPKSGKKIIFERITWLWNILSFKRKMTIRNLLRYKGRNMMTLFGVAGCTMLIVTGYGISDTISGIVDKQMTEIQTYNAMVYLNSQQESDDVEAFMMELTNNPAIEDFVPIYTEQLETNRSDKVNQAISVVVPLVDDDALADFISLRRRSQPDETLALSTEGVILTERIAEHLSFDEGEVLELKDETEQLFEFQVSAITEHYIGHSLYLSPQTYEKQFLKEAQANAFYIQYAKGIDSRQLEKDFSSDDRILTLLNLETVADQAGQSLGSLDVITIVLIISAAGLAFVVLYNLTNINIAERMRELSTIKVLGFYNQEVSMYIFEEILVLTSIGSILGLGLGNLLTSFLMKMMQPNNLLFHPIIYWDSYLVSAGLTFLFSSIVMLFMHQKLRKIDMVEALKAVD
ncbi:FtsX-like permease family protein [Fundicoccus sp. Sow4_D5]|uniref:FtsX-like permease family protein n=1 Tax=Fundicoccus sp. Sow4_D5 TaxID=3438782 RepID=UPI003F93832F